MTQNQIQWSWGPLECEEGFKIYKSSRHTHPSLATLCCSKIISKSLHEWYSSIFRHFFVWKVRTYQEFLSPSTSSNACKNEWVFLSFITERWSNWNRQEISTCLFHICFHTYLKQAEPFRQSSHHRLQPKKGFRFIMKQTPFLHRLHEGEY